MARKAADRNLTTTLYEVHPMRKSVNGNPRWRLMTEHGVYCTKVDTAMALEITGEHWSLVGKRVVMTMSGPDRVWRILPA